MVRKAYVMCPYCGRYVPVDVDGNRDQRRVVDCITEDGESPGCGKSFVADVTVKLDVKALKIEGEEDKK